MMIDIPVGGHIIRTDCFFLSPIVLVDETIALKGRVRLSPIDAKEKSRSSAGPPLSHRLMISVLRSDKE